MAWSDAEEKEYQELKKQAAALRAEQVDPPADMDVGLLDPLELVGGAASGAAKLGTAAVKGAAAGTGKLAQFLSRKLAGAKPMQAEVYKKSPELVESISKGIETNPEGVLTALRNELSKGIKGTKDVTNKLRSEKLQKLAGKEARISPEQFKGTAVEEAVKDIIAKQQAGIPVRQTAEGLIDAAGRDIGSYVVKDPKALTVTGTQLDRLASTAGEAAKFDPNQALVQPLNYKAKQAANRDAKTALTKAMIGVAPDVAPINAKIHKNLRALKLAEKLDKNPEALTKSAMKSRAIGQVLDRAGQSNIGGLSDLVSTAKAPFISGDADHPWSLGGMARSAIGRPVGKLGLRTVGAAEKLGKTKTAQSLAELLGAGAGQAGFQGAVGAAQEGLTSLKPQEQWSDQDEAEYQLLKQQALQLGK